MGYFSNGTEGEMYEDEYCARCIHQGSEDGPLCPVMELHWLHNYDECNKPDSFLHTLIPRGDGGLYNAQCAMFYPRPSPGIKEPVPLEREREAA